LIVEDRVLGVLHAGTLEPRRFDRDDQELLQLVAERVAIAIERALVHERLIRLDQMQRSFIAIASHELRSAVAAIYGISATLHHRGHALQPRQLDELRGTLYRQSELLHRLVEQLLDLSRLEAETFRIRPKRWRSEHESNPCSQPLPAKAQAQWRSRRPRHSRRSSTRKPSTGSSRT
jgi:K+-sensing histidine kinase KdpD